MLRPPPMKHVRLLVLTEDLPHVSLTLAETESFHADARAPAETRLAGAPGRAYRELFQQASTRLEKIGKLIPPGQGLELGEVRTIEQPELAQVNEWLGEIWGECSRYEEQLRTLDEEARLVREQEAALANFENLNIDLGLLRSKTRFLDFYVGIVPRENVRRLEGAVGLAHHLLVVYMTSGDQAHLVIVGPTGAEQGQISSVLGAAGFQGLPIPPELDREPGALHARLAQRRAAIAAERAALRERLRAWSATFDSRLWDAQRILALAEPFVTLDPAIRSSGHLAHLAGWVPARSVARLEERLHTSLAKPFAFETRDPLPDERPLVPTVPARNRLLRPFAVLVRQYGIPEYGQVDPTGIFAATFLPMFGAMFGDVGQGAVIAALAWLLRARLGRLHLFGVLAGLSSVCFGFLYGSVFGYEDLLPALWMSPLHDPILMLELALTWGVSFLVLAGALAVYNRLVIGDWAGAILGHQGLVNLILYLVLVWGGVTLATGGAFGTLPILLLAASLGALAVADWRRMAAPVGEKIPAVLIATLETLIGYLSNTLSFLRVAAFSLNHVALAFAVLTLAGMMDTFGHLAIVVIGNLFMIVLEGGIVTIQVLRLELYEGFTRYFSGDGHAFAPLRLRREQATDDE